MTLTNLLAIQRLQAFEASAEGVQRLLTAAYKCILQCAMLGLWAQGYRTATSQPGHHQTALQSLPLTMALPKDVIIVLDALRKKRNQNDDEGDPVNQAVVTECIAQARSLLAHTRHFLQTQFPALLK